MTGPADRLRALSELAGYETPSEFARAAGVPEGNMRQHLNRNSIPKDAGSLYVARAKKTGATLDWLLNNKGKPPIGISPEQKPAPVRGARSGPNSIAVPELEVHAMAGLGADGTFEITEADASDAIVGEYSFPSNGFRQNFGAVAGQVIITEVVGDSMSPTLPPGTKVMVNLSDKGPTPAGIFFIWDGMGLVIKRLELIPNSSPLKVKIMSDNPRYPTYERTAGEVHINGRVVVGLTKF